MGLFNKGTCIICKKNCNSFNSSKIQDGYLCSNCQTKLIIDGITNESDLLADLTTREIERRIELKNKDLTELPIIKNPSINLKNKEICYYEGNAYSYHIKNVITRYEREGVSSGFRIAKGLTIGKSAGVSHAIREDVVDKYPATFYITNQRFILVSIKYGFELEFNKLTSIKTFSNGFEFYSNSKSHTVLTSDVKYITKLFALMAENMSDEEENEKDIVKELKDLKLLLDEGIITQEEFDKKKKQLLGI